MKKFRLKLETEDGIELQTWELTNSTASIGIPNPIQDERTRSRIIREIIQKIADVEASREKHTRPNSLYKRFRTSSR